jgi:gliding motility-associated-like protein
MKKILLTVFLLINVLSLSTGQFYSSYKLIDKNDQRVPITLSNEYQSVQLCNLELGVNYALILSSLEASICPAQMSLEDFDSAMDGQLTFTAENTCAEIYIRRDCSELIIDNYTLTVSRKIKDQKKENSNSEKEVLANIVTSQNSNVSSLIQDVFIGGDCFEVTGVNFSGTSGQLGTFTSGTASINIEDGVIISTGAIGNVPGPNSSASITTGYFDAGTDSDLDAISGGGTLYDIAQIDFDFTPTEDQITFEYAFASDEYCEFAGTQFNDVFGFFISGPGINGPYSNNSENIAIIPGTGDNVAINSINHYTNVAYYLDNSITETCGSGFPVAPNDIEFDGFTTVLTAIANVIPCETYHIKLIIADRGDDIYDSAVFLKANSFGGDPEANVTSEISGNAASEIAGYEGCSDALITFTRIGNDLSEDVLINYTISNQSTATAGVDYEALPGSIVIPAGQESVTVSIEIYLDLIAEGMESIFIELQQACSCEASLVEVQIFDAPPIEVTLPSLEVCADTPTTITPLVSGGIPPLSYVWNDGSTSESIEVNITEPTMYSVSVADDCNTAEATTFTLVPIAETAIMSGDGQICGGNDAVNFTIDFTGSGPWNITITYDGIPTTVNNITNNPYLFTASQPGTYVLTSVESANGCPVNFSGEATISESSNFATLSGDGELCGGSNAVTMSIDLTGAGPWNITYAVNGNPITVTNITENPFFFEGTIAGTYELIEVESADGCPVEVSGQGTITEVVNTAILSGQGEICGGSNAVTMSVDLPGNGPWNVFYTVNGNQEALLNVSDNPLTFEGTAAGTYELTAVESADGCPIDVSGQGTVTEAVNIATISGQGEVCGGNSFANMTIDLPGDGPWHVTYSTNGQPTTLLDVTENPLTVAGTEPGTYQLVSVEAADGCPIDVSGQGNIIEVPISVTSTTDPVSCNGGDNGMIQFTPQGGTEPYTYNWAEGSFTDPVLTGLSSGLYYISVYDAFGCESIINVQIIEPTELSVQVIDIEDVDCNNMGGTVSLSAEGGTAPYDFSWENGSNTDFQDNLDPGNYSITVTDDNECVTTIDAMVQDLIEYPIAVAQASPINCYNDQALITADGSTVEDANYEWLSPDGITITQNEGYINVYEPGIYTLLVTNVLNHCTTEFPIEVITDLEAPQVDAGEDTILDCVNTEAWLNGTTINPNPDYNYQWFTTDGNILQGDQAPDVQVDEPGTYTLTVLDEQNGCVGEDIVDVQENTDLPEVIVEPPNPITCDVPEVIISALGSTYGPGIEYEWFTADGTLIGPLTGEQVSATAGGTYELVITDTNNGCVNSMEVILPIDTLSPIANAGEDFELDCLGNSVLLNGSGSSTGSNFIYEWVTSDGTILSGQNTATPETDAAGIYTLMVTDTNNGCTDLDQTQVFNSMGALTLSADVEDILNCYNPSIQISGIVAEDNADYFVLWTSPDGNPIVNPGNLEIAVSHPGIYQMEVVNTENGCVSNFGVEVFQDTELPVANAGADQLVNCYDGLAGIDASGSDFGGLFEIEWTQPDGLIANVNTLSWETSVPGIYTLQITNTENGCTSADEVEIIPDFVVPVSDAGPDMELNCLVTDVQLNGFTDAGSDDLHFEWIDLQTQNIITDSSLQINIQQEGFYSLQVLNLENGCTSADTVFIDLDIESPLAVAEVEDEINCENDEVNLLSTASSQGDEFSYLWSLPVLGIDLASTQEFAVDYAGTYQLVVINVNNHCSDTAFVTVNENFEMPVAMITEPEDITCQQLVVSLDGSASSAGNEFIYTWTLPDGSSSMQEEAPEFSASAVGTYTLEVLNTSNGCTDEASVEVISLDELPTSEAGPSQIINCYNSAVMLDPAGSSTGANFSYTWQEQNGSVLNASASLESIVITEPGIYEFIVTDTDNGCASADAVVVNIDITPPEAEAGSVATLTCTEANINLDGSESSQGNMTFAWSTSTGNILSGENDISPLVDAPGIYDLVVTNLDNGCQATDVVEVTIDTVYPQININPAAVLTCDLTTVNLQGNVDGNYEITWLDENDEILGSSDLLPVESPGNYTMVALNTINGCESALSTTVDQDITPPVAEAGATGMLTCANTSLELDGTSSSGNSSYLWTTSNGNILSGSTGLTPLVNEPGSYLLLVTDNTNGCQSTDEVIIDQDVELPAAVAATSGVLTCVTTEVDLIGTSNNGTVFEYEWQLASGQTFDTGNQIISISTPGTYQFYVYNPENGCDNSSTVMVEQDIETPDTDAGEAEDLTCIITNLTLEGSVINSSGNSFNYSWTGPNGGIIANANSLSPIVQSPGTYTLLVTNLENGCSATDEVEVNLIAPAGIETDLQQPLCHGDPAYLDIFAIEGGAEPYLYSINGGSTFTQSEQFSLLSPGWHLLVVQDANGCEFSEGVFVEDIPPLEIDLEPLEAIKLGESYQINALVNYPEDELASITWTPADSLSCSDCLTPLASPLHTTDYFLEVISDKGCRDDALLRIIVDERPAIYIPNVFSPNGDGNNEVFQIFAKENTIEIVNSLQIYTRWGELVFEVYDFPPNDPQFGWDGYHRGIPVNSGVFVYWTEVELVNGRKTILKGDVTVIY